MAFNYDKMIEVVIKSLNNFGTEITLQQSSNLDIWEKKFNPLESRDYWENSTDGEIVYIQPTADILKSKVLSIEDSFTTSEKNSEMTKIGDKKIYLSPTLEPYIEDKLIKDNIVYNIYYKSTIKPADKTLLYLVYIRN